VEWSGTQRQVGDALDRLQKGIGVVFTRADVLDLGFRNAIDRALGCVRASPVG
jgi:hypothetical protein